MYYTTPCMIYIKAKSIIYIHIKYSIRCAYRIPTSQINIKCLTVFKNNSRMMFNSLEWMISSTAPYVV